MTFRRTLHYYLLRLRRLQQQPVAVQATDTTAHACRHCGHEYVGRRCPMCGMPGSWQRFTWRRLLSDFLDIWGMGNRPMFRSMGHLLWQPGYMIRDSLGGHYLSYFPPFKMLTVLTMFVVLAIWLLGIDTKVPATATTIVDGEAAAHYAILENYQRVRDFLLGNALYALLLQMVAIVWLLLTQTFIRNSLFPFSLPEVVVLALLAFDFRQLYGLSARGAVCRTMLVVLLLLALYLAFMFTAIAILFAAVGVERLVN